ncbi:MAG TPA: COX15/CtaA family protein [Pseudonocardiaceae bacterium]|nr:COX15/CtaA family protein [Pseudonocardiaceae bacterium]
MAAVAAQAAIAVTGSVVRVTGSGLGCPDWPGCFEESWVPDPRAEVAWLHQWVEFGNRLMTVVVGIVAVACFAVMLLAEPRRRRVVALAAAMPIGVAVQGVIGGMTVYVDLAWWSVSIHLLLSMVLVWLAVMLVRAVSEGDGPPRPVIGRMARRLLMVAVGLLAPLLFAGTLVTAAGPHAGDAETPRLDMDIELLAKMHAGLLYAFGATLLALGVALWRENRRHTSAWRRYVILLAVVAAQGTLGLVQYWTGLPEVLVSLHVLGAASVVIATAALWVSTRDRGPAVPSRLGQTAGAVIAD